MRGYSVLRTATAAEAGPVRISAAACRIRSGAFVAGVRGGRRKAAGTRSDEMTRYLISFDNGAMDHIPEEEIPEVGKAAHAVVQEAKEAGVFVFAGGLRYDDGDADPAVVAVDGMVTDGPYPESKELIGGVFVVDVPTREAALEWAAKVAAACRCAQDVRKFLHDPDAV
jgi:hypothetical protein